MCEPAAHRLDMARQAIGVAGLSGKDIAPQGFNKLCSFARVESRVIGGGSPVKGLGERLHPFRHAQIADADFAQTLIEPPKGDVCEVLRDVMSRRRQFRKPPQNESEMERQKLESPFETVGNSEIGKKLPLARQRGNAIM
jgi:hypothetical protein